ncbi:hypothetical protein [Trinickia violacea]|uniref:hypothetical protein n=1 Tax=Trinickia violacea TaxID=2571746 RepID=UPI001585F607|nr:hypothetical protein [Trinickia violacea]
MKKIYPYRGFEVSVELEPLFEPSRSVTLRAPTGFFAVVRLFRAGATLAMVASLRLPAAGSGPFHTEADALMAAFSAGQRLIDGTMTDVRGRGSWLNAYFGEAERPFR